MQLTPVLVLALAACAWGDPLVTLEQGALRGHTVTSRGGRSFLAFQGIPYAAPPLGDLRFKPPQPVAAWGGERSAQTVGSSCSQINYLTRVYEGQEDCLYLNVYTPRLEREGAGLSVMVWVHGGGFYSGSGSTEMYCPKVLLDQDIILVTINYRLGAQGFLSLGTPEAPGNYGLKDQVAALRWVQNNIAKFGGNPDSVTIFGESAGGASIHYLMLSPLARGLFHRAIAQSGSVYNNWAYQRRPREMALDLAAKFECQSEDTNAVLSCLRGVDTKKLAEMGHVLIAEKKRDTVFTPAAEPTETEGAFLTEDPRSIFARGDVANVPFMAGLLTHEGIYHLGSLYFANKSAAEDLQTNFARYVPEELGLTPGSSEYLAAWSDIKAFYESQFPGDPTEQFVLLNTDAEFVPGVDDLVRGVASLNRSPVYYYQFSYDGGLGLIKNLMHLKYNGTCHGDELGYLFTGPFYPPLATASPADIRTIERVTKLWSNFARTGNPTPDSSMGVSWAAVSSPLNEPKLAATRYLDIGTQLVMKEGNLNAERVAFWQKIREQHHNL